MDSKKIIARQNSNAKQIISELRIHSNPKNLEGMKRFGIETSNALGVSVPIVRKIAKKTGKNHLLALELWNSGIHEARILASMIAEAEKTDGKLMDSWIKEFNSWDLCDQCCMNLFSRTDSAFKKALEWSSRKNGFEKRAGFALMAALAVHGKKANDAEFEKFFHAIERESIDERNFVKKAVNWALRQAGKRNPALHKKAVAVAKKIKSIDSKSAKWISSNALTELESVAVKKRLNGKEKRKNQGNG